MENLSPSINCSTTPTALCVIDPRLEDDLTTLRGLIGWQQINPGCCQGAVLIG
jgi:hypothetical protein